MQDESSLKFAARLALALRQAHMRASRLAENAHVSKGYVSDLLSGKKERPSIDVCVEFAKVLGVSLPWLAYGEEPDQAQNQSQHTTLKEDPPAYRFTPRAQSVDSTASDNLVEAAQSMASTMKTLLSSVAEMQRRIEELEQIIKKGPNKDPEP